MSNRRRPRNPQTASHPHVEHDPLVKATAVLWPRLGATSFELRYSEPEHAGSPVVWLAIAFFPGAQPQVAAGLMPGVASFRLAEQLVDGGMCTHCERPTGITLDLEEQLLAEHFCWYQFDPELAVFRRGCA